MLHHVSVGVSDVERAAKFYDPVLKALGYRRLMEFLPYAIGYGERGGGPEFWIGLPHNQQAPTSGNGTHVGFQARNDAKDAATISTIGFVAGALLLGGGAAIYFTAPKGQPKAGLSVAPQIGVGGGGLRLSGSF